MTTRTAPRRDFLKLAAASAAAGFPAILPSRARGAGAPGGLLQIGVIGCGRIAASMDIPGILKHPGLARIVAVADWDSRRAGWAKEQVEKSYAKATGQGVSVSAHRDYRELIAREDIDAVMVCTPDHWHAQPVVEAALAGKDIYVQKPLTLTLAEGRLVSDVVRAKRRILQIGSQQRSERQFQHACELVRNGVIGRAQAVEIGLPTDPPGGNPAGMAVPAALDYEAWLGCTPSAPYTEDRVHPQSDDPKKRFSRPGWLRLRDYTCGMITGWGAHHVDIAHWGLGVEESGPVSVEARAEWPGADSFWNVHGKYDARLGYAGGVTVRISDELPTGVKFIGDGGWIFVSRGAQGALKALDASDPKLLAVPDEELKTKLHRSPGWDHHLDWLEAMRARTPATTNAETGHRSCSACLIAWIGMNRGRPLKWDAEAERFDDAEANAMLHRPEREPYGAFAAAKRAGFTQFHQPGGAGKA